jgi:hypothetical protein
VLFLHSSGFTIEPIQAPCAYAVINTSSGNQKDTYAVIGQIKNRLLRLVGKGKQILHITDLVLRPENITLSVRVEMSKDGQVEKIFVINTSNKDHYTLEKRDGLLVVLDSQKKEKVLIELVLMPRGNDYLKIKVQEAGTGKSLFRGGFENHQISISFLHEDLGEREYWDQFDEKVEKTEVQREIKASKIIDSSTPIPELKEGIILGDQLSVRVTAFTIDGKTNIPVYGKDYFDRLIFNRKQVTSISQDESQYEQYKACFYERIMVSEAVSTFPEEEHIVSESFCLQKVVLDLEYQSLEEEAQKQTYLQCLNENKIIHINGSFITINEGIDNNFLKSDSFYDKREECLSKALGQEIVFTNAIVQLNLQVKRLPLERPRLKELVETSKEQFTECHNNYHLLTPCKNKVLDDLSREIFLEKMGISNQEELVSCHKELQLVAPKAPSNSDYLLEEKTDEDDSSKQGPQDFYTCLKEKKYSLDLGLFINEEDYSLIKDHISKDITKEALSANIKTCLEKRRNGLFDKMSTFVQTFSSSSKHCINESIYKEYLPYYTLTQKELLERYFSEDEVSKKLDYLLRNIKNTILQATSVLQITELLQKNHIYVFSYIGKESALLSIDKALGPMEDEKVKEYLQKQIEKKILKKVVQYPKNPIGIELLTLLKKKANKRERTIFLRDFISNAESVLAQTKATVQVSKLVLPEKKKLELLDNRVKKADACFKKYSPNNDAVSVKKFSDDCHKMIHLSYLKELTHVQAKYIVGNALKEGSIFQKVLKTFDQCINKVPVTLPLEKYHSTIEFCSKNTFFDIRAKMTLNNILDSKDLVGPEKFEAAKKLYQSCFSTGINELSNISKEQKLRLENVLSRTEAPLIEMLTLELTPHELVDFLADTTKKFDISLTDDCEKGIYDILSAPVLNIFNEYYGMNISQTLNKQLFLEVFDKELLNLFRVVLSSNKEDDKLRIFSGDEIAFNKLLSPKASATSLLRIFAYMNKLISQGNKFDQEKLKHSLLILKTNLKRRINNSIKSNSSISVRDIKTIFLESEFGDLLIRGMMSERLKLSIKSSVKRIVDYDYYIYPNLKILLEKQNKIEEIKQREAQLGLAHNRAKYAVMELPFQMSNKPNYTEFKSLYQKHKLLNGLANEVTGPEEMKYVLHVLKTKQPRDYQFLLHAYALPKILGVEVDEQLDKMATGLISRAALTLEGDGDLASRFISVIARAELTVDEKEMSRLYRWVWDDTDFDWSIVKQTKNGKEALKYFQRFILLPRMVGINETNYGMNHHIKKFREYLEDGQYDAEDYLEHQNMTREQK